MSEPDSASDSDSPRWELTISSTTQRASVTISALEIPAAANQSINLLAAIADDGFTGADDVWASESDLRKFVVQLRELERTRCGSATLKALDPAALELVIEPFDAAGHMQISASITAHRYGPRTRHYTVTTRTMFEIDAGLLMSLFVRFRELWQLCAGEHQRLEI
jgi:hypothetical protein